MTFRETLRDAQLWKSVEEEWRTAFRKYLNNDKFTGWLFSSSHCEGSHDSREDKYLCALALVHPEIRLQAADLVRKQMEETLRRISSEPLSAPENNFPMNSELPGADVLPITAAAVSTDVVQPVKAVTSSQSEVAIERVWEEHDVLHSGRMGMLIHAEMQLDNFEGQQLTAIAFFHSFDLGTLLTNPAAACHRGNDELCAENDFVPPSRSTHADVQLFLPYGDIPSMNLPKQNLKYHVHIRRVPYDGDLVTSEWRYFTFER